MSSEKLQKSASNQLFTLHMSLMKYIVLIDNNELIEQEKQTNKYSMG